MSWQADLEKLLRDQMPYAFPKLDPATGSSERTPIDEEMFKDALGYITELVLVERKKAYFAGYASGAEDTVHDVKVILRDLGPSELPEDFTFDKDLSRVGAERAWLKRESDRV